MTQYAAMRVGAISYLNAMPLTYGLPWPMLQATPADLQAILLRGELDLALCSVTTALCHEGFFIVPELGIGCRGPVASVRLIFQPGIAAVPECRRIAVDAESNTANLLLQVLVRLYYRCPADRLQLVVAGEEADAHLVIGDRALHHPSTAHEADLGAVWSEWTGLPFVFAVWITPHATIPTSTFAVLCNTRNQNLAQLNDLVGDLVDRSSTIPDRLTYLRRHISYQLGIDEMKGIEHFHGYLQELHLAPPRPLPLTRVG